MRVYVTVEGKVGERRVYECWIPLVNPGLTCVEALDDIRHNNFAVLAGGGQPGYFEVIRNAIDDVNEFGQVDRLVISIDSEDMSHQEKYQEVIEVINQEECGAEIVVVVQHFCFETWALGNRLFGPRQPRTPELIEYKQMFNVLVEDPELLPSYDEKNLNRAQFAFKYLRTMLREKRNIYSKAQRKVVCHPSYFNQLKDRLEKTSHIRSFSNFIDAFKPLDDPIPVNVSGG